ncbi:MAG: hypothetical protein HC879_20900 [Leptolyngbyaceae cyanobacterium SL_5_9]|nr:hypothetical protein [Leptolyngbyaceae cyanobacterium SL_5_9]NJO76312.1 hypothetical protein [Leptolyngbyaceae cyanobacterium RM1_406_9]
MPPVRGISGNPKARLIAEVEIWNRDANLVEVFRVAEFFC